MQPNILANACCLIAALAFGASAVLALALVRQRTKHHNAPPQPAARPTAHVQPFAPPAQTQHVGANPAPLPYAAIPTLLTTAERQFFATLQAAVPHGMLICPQVRLANLVQATAKRSKQQQYDFYRIQAKCVDFVLCDPATTAPRLVIELDDSSHTRQDRPARDAFVDAVLAAALLPILHVPWQRSYDVAQLAAAISMQLGMPETAANQHEAAGWTKPIAVQPHRLTLPPSLRYEPQHACGTCHGVVPPSSRYCTHCGTPFAQPLVP